MIRTNLVYNPTFGLGSDGWTATAAAPPVKTLTSNYTSIQVLSATIATSIQSASAYGSTSAIYTSANHGLTNGATVTITGFSTYANFNITATAITVLDPNTFRATMAGSVTGTESPANAVVTPTSSFSVNFTTATPHNLTTGQYFSISGFSHSSYNVSNPITVLSATKFRVSPFNAATVASETPASPLTGIVEASYYGDSFGAVTKVSSNPAIYNTTKIPVTAGNVYTLSSYVKIPLNNQSGTYQVSILWYDSGASLLSTSTSTGVSLTSSSGWTRLSVTATAPSTATQVEVKIGASGSSTLGSKFLVDAVQLENNSYATAFVEPINQLQENTKANSVLRPVPAPHLTGIELNADIMINNLLLNTVDNNNVLWVCTDIEGWWDLPDPEIQDLTRGLDDGSYDVRGRYTARVMTLNGSILVPDRSYTAAARDRLISAINLVATGGWLIVDENPTKAAYVRLSGRPSIKVVNARGRIDFSVGLKAANPVKFKWNWNDANGYASTTIAAAGSTVINNEGNFDVPMVLTMTGGSGGLTAPITVTNTTTGKTLTVIKNIRGSSYNVSISTSQVASGVVTLGFGATVHSFLVGDVVNVASISTAGRTGLNTTGAVITAVTSTTISFAKAVGDLASASTNGTVTLANADTLEIDTYNKSATFNGSATIARSYIDTLTDWVYLQPGNNTVQFSPTSGSTTLAVKYRSGWIG